MTNLLAARSLFGVSLAFHIVFAAVGVAMPLFMVLAEARALRSGSEVHRELARRWAKGTAILFAVGAVSGTVISFELGLLWPRFMAFAGPIIGMPFSLEGFAFFTEAIFLGIYLYGWGRVSPAAAPGGGGGGGGERRALRLLRHPGQRLDERPRPASAWTRPGAAVDVRPFAAMFSPGWAHEVVHVLISCYVATGFAVAGIHAFFLRAQPDSALPPRRAAHRAGRGRAPRPCCSRSPATSPPGRWPGPSR